MYDINLLELNKIKDILKNYCKTDYAKNKALSLDIPNSYDEIIKLNNETKEAFQSIVKYGDIQISNIDVSESLKRAEIGAILSELELLDIASLIDNINTIIRYFKTLDDIKVDTLNLKEYLNKLTPLNNLRNSITMSISPDGRVVDNASKELFMARRNINSYQNKLRSKLNELLVTQSSKLSDQLIVIRNGRMCLPVKIEYKNSFGGIVHDLSSSNTTAYIEPESCVQISNQIESYQAEEKRQIAIILKNLTLLVAAEAESLDESFKAIVSLDLIFAKALMGKDLNYEEANIINEQKFILKHAKHPLIDKDKVVPIDIELGNKFSSIIITGPNTGGKTVALKTVGLIHLMAYLGLFIPLDNTSKLGYFENILVDIGDEQSIEQSLSTFSAHMTKIVRTLDKINDKSLVLFDELGSGTDPKEGSSLAVAIIDYLMNKNVKVIATTHYSELKTFAYNNQNVCNASVEFNADTLMPTYRLLLGIPGKSNAIEIAKKLGLKDEIILKAKEELESNTTQSSEFMSSLEAELTKIRQKEEELEKKEALVNKELEQAKLKRIELQNKTDDIISKAKMEANNIINKTKEDSKKLIDEIKNMSSIEFKEHEMASLKHKVKSLEEIDTEDLENYEFQVGDYVFIKSYEKYGTISAKRKDKFVVNVGQFAMEFSASELKLSAKPKPKPQKETKLSGYNPASHASLSLDLRGKRYEEVKPLMDQYLDQALLGNLESVTIIHGFGTGAIRKAVQEYLKNCSFVKSYRYGKEGEGLNGVTVVFLK